ncbi:MAG: glutamine synthetase [Alphaproteobacteria bacterium]|nr:glutamine synthetase [Alphaproteobacteria bacterium]
MDREALVFVGTCDLAGLVRGKGFPAAELPGRLRKGVGLTHSNIMMSAFGPIYDTPFGTRGDLMLVPDPTTKVEVAFEDAAERFYLADIMTTDGEPWECCPRDFLRRGLAELDREAQASLLAAFEQEFVYTGVEERPGATYALDAYRRAGSFGEAYMAALRSAGLTPDSFLPEYGGRQYEVTIAPTPGVRAADEAVIQREMARAVAHRLGHRAILAPMLVPDGIGNGTHIHFSLRDRCDRPVMHDATAPYGLSDLGRRFVAGILRHLPALCALTAPAVSSYYRLQPDRWAPTWANLGIQDRGASLRICPIFLPAIEEPARQFNVEYRVADAAASPYLALGALVWAGVDGIRRNLPLVPPAQSDFWTMTEAERAAAGARPLPRSLSESLGSLEATRVAKEWLGGQFLDLYIRFKRAEQRALEGLDRAEICARYAAVY